MKLGPLDQPLDTVSPVPDVPLSFETGVDDDLGLDTGTAIAWGMGGAPADWPPEDR